MRLYQKAKKLGTWDPRDIDPTQDVLDWQRLPPEHQARLRTLIASFQAGEEAVTVDLLPLIMAIAQEGHLEEELFLTAFLWEEGKHTEFFRRVIGEVSHDQGDLHAKCVQNTRDLFADDLPTTMNHLLVDPSPQNQVQAAVLYNMVLEGVLAETGYYSISRVLGASGMMPGLLQGVQLIKRDESRHIAYGVYLVSRLVAADPSLWPLVEECMNGYFAFIAREQEQNGTPESTRLYARQQFEKRLARIAKACGQSSEQLDSIAEEEPV